MNNNTLNKIKNTNILVLLFLIIVFVPKIDLISIPGFWQGIRIDDVILAVVGLIFLINKKKIIFSYKKFYNSWFYFFIYIFFSNLVALLLGYEIKFVMILRLIEYLIVIIFIYNLNLDKLFLRKVIKYFILLNVFVVFFQINGLVGSISSLGYLPAGAALNTRAYGLLGGSWELAIITSLSYFILLYVSEKKNEKIKYLFICLFLLYTANSRMPIAAFLVGVSIFYFFENIKFKQKILDYKFKGYYLFTGILFLIYFFCLINFSNYFKYDFGLDYFNNFNLSSETIINLISNLLVYNDVPSRAEFNNYDFSYWSLLYRLEHWSNLYDINLSEPFSFIFGSGLNVLYTDSLLVRIFLNCGFVGLLFVALLSLKLPIFLFVFLFLSGLTLDLFISMKIFIFTLLLIWSYKNYAVNRW
ncbi:hypothetical protein IDH22_00940 [Pelagibacterales bacterium SAG-MED35]|nr:hypothetical protein [Pelagibacterales bacterium SAG-MED35]